MTEGDEPRQSGAIGLDVMRVIEAVNASLDLDGARTEIEADLAP